MNLIQFALMRTHNRFEFYFIWSSVHSKLQKYAANGVFAIVLYFFFLCLFTFRSIHNSHRKYFWRAVLFSWVCFRDFVHTSPGSFAFCSSKHWNNYIYTHQYDCIWTHSINTPPIRSHNRWWNWDVLASWCGNTIVLWLQVLRRTMPEKMV